MNEHHDSPATSAASGGGPDATADAVERHISVTPSLTEPLDDVGKHASDSLRRNRSTVLGLTAGAAAVFTWAALRRRRS